MKWLVFIILLIAIVGGAFVFSLTKKPIISQQAIAPASQTTTKQTTMKITSAAFANNQAIPQKYSCEGESVNPPLSFSDIPENAKSLVLLIEDPDVPKNLKPDGVFDHWVVFNIPASTTQLAENTTPPGIQGKNGGGQSTYTAPCPPDRQHRYFFKLYALDSMLNLTENATKSDVEKAMDGHVVGRAELIGLYDKVNK